MSVDFPSAQSLVDAEFAAKISKAEAAVADAILRMDERKALVELLASRPLLSADEILKRSRANDWWLPACLAQEYGFIDPVR